MPFNYSICHPDKELIEYPTELLEAKQVLEFAKSYPWKKQLQLCDEMPNEKIFYSPSLDFKDTNQQSSFGLTADYQDDEIRFSLWYKRPKEIKILFGLLGKTEKMVVDDVSPFSMDEAINYLEHFVNGDCEIIEELYK